MKISIIMPVKNAGLFLEECLDSILNQSIDNWELIAIDDNSSDNSVHILTRYASNDHRIKTITNTSSGIITALRLAYANANGTYITRMDADDIMLPQKLELLLEPLSINGPRSLSVGLVQYFSETTLGEGYRSYANWLNELTSHSMNFDSIYKECTIPSPAWMLHREDLDRCGAFDSNVYPEDYDLAFRMRADNLKVYPTKEIVHLWRDHPTRSSRTHDNYKDNTFLPLKVNHFLRSDHDTSKHLVLWGAGTKGKKIAKLLKAQNISFKWITNNTKKIGKEIYQKILEPDDSIETQVNNQIIITIAHPEEQQEIKRRLAVENKEDFKNSFFFC